MKIFDRGKACAALMLLLFFSSCFKKTVEVDTKEGRVYKVKTHYSKHKGVKLEKWKAYTLSGKLVGKGTYISSTGCWPEELQNKVIWYDTLSGRPIDKFNLRRDR